MQTPQSPQRQPGGAPHPGSPQFSPPGRYANNPQGSTSLPGGFPQHPQAMGAQRGMSQYQMSQMQPQQQQQPQQQLNRPASSAQQNLMNRFNSVPMQNSNGGSNAGFNSFSDGPAINKPQQMMPSMGGTANNASSAMKFGGGGGGTPPNMGMPMRGAPGSPHAPGNVSRLQAVGGGNVRGMRDPAMYDMEMQGINAQMGAMNLQQNNEQERFYGQGRMPTGSSEYVPPEMMEPTQPVHSNHFMSGGVKGMGAHPGMANNMQQYGNDADVVSSQMPQQQRPTIPSPMMQRAAPGGPSPQPPSGTQESQHAKPTSPSSTGPVADKHGLAGLLSVIRMTDPNLNILTLGLDLTTLGLNLNSPEYLYTTFASPWSEESPKIQPEFRIPQCYFMQPPPLKMEQFQELNLETLFYIFYSMPRDLLQVAAAQELYNRDWRYHKEEKRWFIRAPGTEPTKQTNTLEVGSYVVFDVDTWQKIRKDNFTLHYDKIEDKNNLSISDLNQAKTSRQNTNNGSSQ
eukprot:gb/GECH01008623.1/.p1 GENE.gb/GECH01008623.1/~~gb/GECH01008623.1/.p1  ORF type:complete len:512 (+),score=108.65 gb/GECH01008623.1/:1-1536(+)